LRILFVGQFETKGSRQRNEELVYYALSKLVKVDKYFLTLRTYRELPRLSKKYDWILFSTPCIFSIFPDTLKKLKCKACVWTYDWMWIQGRQKKFIPFARSCDIALTTDDMIDWKSYGINHYCLRQGVDSRVHYRDSFDPAYQADVAFTGTIRSKKRQILATKLRNEFGDDFRIWDTVTYRNKGTAGESRRIFRKICASTRVLIGPGKLFDRVKEYWSNRVYITLGCGGFFINEHIPGLEKEFCNGKHLVLTDHPIDSIRYYLNHPGERKKIADAGCKWVHKNHTYNLRVKRLLEILKV